MSVFCKGSGVGVVLALLLSAPHAVAEKKSPEVKLLSFPDVTLNEGAFTLTNLSLKKGGILSLTRLTGTLNNKSGKEWSGLELSVQPSDGIGTQFRRSKIDFWRPGGVQAESSTPFYLKLSGTFDFATLTFSFNIDGSYSPDYHFQIVTPSREDGQLRIADDKVEIVLLPGTEQFGFRIQNKGASTLKLNWDQMTFVNTSGVVDKVLGSGVRYIERAASRPPSIIPPGARMQDIFVPVSLISYSQSYSRYSTSSWITESILPKCPKCLELVGKDVSVYFPLESDGKTLEYTMTVRVVAAEPGATVSEKQTPAPTQQVVTRVAAPSTTPVATRNQSSVPVAESQAPAEAVRRGGVTFTSSPGDAEVLIDDVYWGTTPTAEFTNLKAGEHTVTLKKQGYQAWVRKDQRYFWCGIECSSGIRNRSQSNANRRLEIIYFEDQQGERQTSRTPAGISRNARGNTTANRNGSRNLAPPQIRLPVIRLVFFLDLPYRRLRLKARSFAGGTLTLFSARQHQGSRMVFQPSRGKHIVRLPVSCISLRVRRLVSVPCFPFF